MSARNFVRSPRTRSKKANEESILEEITTKTEVSLPATTLEPGLLLWINIVHSFWDNSPDFGNTPDTDI